MVLLARVACSRWGLAVTRLPRLARLPFLRVTPLPLLSLYFRYPLQPVHLHPRTAPSQYIDPAATRNPPLLGPLLLLRKRRTRRRAASRSGRGRNQRPRGRT